MLPDRIWARRALRTFGWALAALLTGYMFLGRGFAHIGVGPVYVGEVVLALALIALLIVRPPLRLHWLHIALLTFMAWGLVRTVPFIGSHGINALREGALWGYALFAIAVSLLASVVALRFVHWAYRWVAVAFVFWVPPAWWIFGTYGELLPKPPGSDLPILYVKNPDFAVHLIGVAAFLVVGALTTQRGRRRAVEVLVAVPLAFGLYLTLSLSRGAMATAAAGLAALLVVRPRSPQWLSLLISAVLVTVFVVVDPLASVSLAPSPAPSGPAVTGEPEPTPSGSVSATPRPRPTPTPTATPEPTPRVAREVSTDQLFDNITSIFGESSDENLEGTKRFRLGWWREIIDYTFNGPYFWQGKGFGVNLADADGFQVAEGVMRAPHNSHLSILARMGVPGFGIWIVLQVGFGIVLLLAAIRAHRLRLGLLSQLSAWVLVYWTAIMVNTSFDPYLEGPQGAIWFWSVFGLGLACIREIGSAARAHDR